MVRMGPVSPLAFVRYSVTEFPVKLVMNRNRLGDGRAVAA
jgi:hypothetical protein